MRRVEDAAEDAGPRWRRQAGAGAAGALRLLTTAVNPGSALSFQGVLPFFVVRRGGLGMQPGGARAAGAQEAGLAGGDLGEAATNAGRHPLLKSFCPLRGVFGRA